MNLLSTFPTGAIQADLYALEGNSVVTVNMKKVGEGMVSYWMVTTLGSDSTLKPSFYAQVPLTSRDSNPQTAERLAFEECEELYENAIRNIVIKLDGSTSLASQISDLEHEVRLSLAVVHMKLHDELQHLGNAGTNLNDRTAREYQIAKALGLGTVVMAMAKFEGAPTTAITRRLTRARDAGLIEKQLVTTRARKNAPKSQGSE
jgi:hypothetical protein